MVGIKARHSCLTASQRLLRCVSARSTGDPTGVYPQLCKLQTSNIFSPRATAWAPPPLIPHTSVSRLRQKENFANLGRGVIFSSGDGGPLHSALPHPHPGTLPTFLLAGLDRQTMDLGPSAPVGSRKLHRACSRCLCLPFIPYVSGGRVGYCTLEAGSRGPGGWMVLSLLLTGWSLSRLSSSLSLSFLIYPVNIDKACGLIVGRLNEAVFGEELVRGLGPSQPCTAALISFVGAGRAMLPSLQWGWKWSRAAL